MAHKVSQLLANQEKGFNNIALTNAPSPTRGSFGQMVVAQKRTASSSTASTGHGYQPGPEDSSTRPSGQPHWQNGHGYQPGPSGQPPWQNGPGYNNYAPNGQPWQSPPWNSYPNQGFPMGGFPPWTQPPYTQPQPGPYAQPQTGATDFQRTQSAGGTANYFNSAPAMNINGVPGAPGDNPLVSNKGKNFSVFNVNKTVKSRKSQKSRRKSKELQSSSDEDSDSD